MDEYNKRLKWFTDRVGYRVYRDKGECECPMCAGTVKHGLIIVDKRHAIYLNDMAIEFNIKYRDKL